jgi:RNA polymerase sigma-70 factor, ECF subfamily
MDENDWLAGRFEANRSRLRAMAYRMLGSLSDAEDAVQEGWIHAAGPEQEAILADSVGLAMLVVLDTLPPAERVAFVLHDTFRLPFDEIAAITGHRFPPNGWPGSAGWPRFWRSRSRTT